MEEFNKLYKSVILESSDFKVGDKVKIKKEFVEKGEEDIEYVVKNINDKTNRVTIEAQVNMNIKPQELVGLEMIEKI